jgi:DNA-binding transcriptional MerR regulator
MEEKTYTIGEIAKLFQIPTSTIRYWEEKEIFSAKRNDENDYREYTIQTIIELLDVVFYRNLNIPIQKMKNFNRLRPEEIYSLLEDTEVEVQQELQHLKKKFRGIARRKEQLESLFHLQEKQYEKEPINIKKIVPFDLLNAEDMQIQLQQLANFVLYKEKEEELFQMGLAVSGESSKKEIWKSEPEQTPLYVTCLLTCDAENFDSNNFIEHKNAMNSQGFSIKGVIASYLATASEGNGKTMDYYKAWLEIVPL